MGINNFYKKNAKNYYAYADFKEVLNDTLKQEFKDNYYKHTKTISFSSPYDGTELGEIEALNITHEKTNYSDYYKLNIYINPVIRLGYYKGANLDYNINFEFYCDNEYGISISFNNDDCITDATYEENLLQLIKVIKHNIKYNKRLIKKINKDFYNNIDKLENLYSKLSTPIRKVAGFSNGTAIYETNK